MGKGKKKEREREVPPLVLPTEIQAQKFPSNEPIEMGEKFSPFPGEASLILGRAAHSKKSGESTRKLYFLSHRTAGSLP
jgi:hypothetical protein